LQVTGTGDQGFVVVAAVEEASLRCLEVANPRLRWSLSRHWSSSFFGCCVMRISRILNLLKERNCGTMLSSSAKTLSRENSAEELLTIQALGASVELSLNNQLFGLFTYRADIWYAT
jgi:hypothetical protein